MVPVSLYDRVKLDVVPGRRGVSCRVIGPQRVAGGRANLAARAADAVLDATGARARVRLVLDKRIPAGAGLGGGSSDAAAVLRALPALLGERLGGRALLDLARSIGADVAFFLACRPARATGVGDVLTPLREFPRADLVIVVPRARVETAWAYGHALARRRGLTSGARGRSRNRHPPRSAKALTSLVFNDFERGVGSAVPDIERLTGRLHEAGALATVMSGTGSAVVGIFESSSRARAAAATFRAPDLAHAVRILRRRPAASR
jgi:4-diphosphocytidyl-2-C-methyl-D-erythritol kinase